MNDAILSILTFGIGLGFVALMLGARLAHYISREITYLADFFFKIQNGIFNTTLSKITEINHIKEMFQEIVLREKKISSTLQDLALKHEEVQIKLDKAQKDTLTGLLSRGLFFQIMQSMTLNNRIHSQSKALLFIDLDGFKNVNDLHGHDHGDHILKRTAEILKTLIRDTDLACRFGGDEFVIYLEASENQIHNVAITVAERIVHRIHEIGYGIGCSIGIAFSDSEFSIDECLRQADLAMYEAKRKGKNQYVVFNVL